MKHTKKKEKIWRNYDALKNEELKMIFMVYVNFLVFFFFFFFNLQFMAVNRFRVFIKFRFGIYYNIH